MTSRAARAGRAAGLLAAAGLLCGGCSLLAQAAGPAAPACTTARPAARAGAQAAAGAVPLASLLPFPPARLQAAADLASRFTTAWDSWSWQQPPAAWLDVTLTPEGSGWLVWDIEPASAGNA